MTTALTKDFAMKVYKTDHFRPNWFGYDQLNLFNRVVSIIRLWPIQCSSSVERDTVLQFPLNKKPGTFSTMFLTKTT